MRGVQAWRAELGCAVFSSPAALPGRAVLVAGVDGALRALSPTGAPLWTTPLHQPVFAPICLSVKLGLAVVGARARAFNDAFVVPKTVHRHGVNGGPVLKNATTI